MAAISAFNEMIEAFLTELSNLRPGDPDVAGAIEALSLAKKTNVKLPAIKFTEAMNPHMERIVAKDDKLFEEVEIEGIPNMKNKWSGMSQGNKDVIWAYIQQLLMLGNGILQLPDSVMQTVEQLAEDIAAGGGADMNKISKVLEDSMTPYKE